MAKTVTMEEIRERAAAEAEQWELEDMRFLLGYVDELEARVERLEEFVE